MLEAVVVPADPATAPRLRIALGQLAEQDPLIDVRQTTRAELSVSLYGEVQKEVIEATLASEYGIEVAFRETTTICVERPTGTGEAVEILNTPANPFRATIGLRVDPAPPGPASPSGSTSTPGRSRSTSTRRSRLRGQHGGVRSDRSGRGSSAGRSPTAS